MVFYRALIQSYIHLCGPEIGVAENLRNVLNRYALADQICCQGPTEPVRVDIAHIGASAEALNNVLDPLLCETAVRILKPDEQCGIIIGPAAEITPEIFGADFGQVKATLLAALAYHCRFPGHEVNTGSVQGDDFGDSESGSVEKFGKSQVPREQTGILQALTFDR